MLNVNETTQKSVSVDVSGESVVDDEIVARYAAHIDPDEDIITITTVIYDKEKYLADDEKEFVQNVCDAQDEAEKLKESFDDSGKKELNPKEEE